MSALMWYNLRFPIDLYTQSPYNVRMEKRIYIRVTDEFVKRVEYLKRINGYKTVSETVRKIVEKEYRKESGEK